MVAILGLGQGAGTEGPRLLSFAPSGNAPVQKTPQVSPEKLVELQKALREGLHKESQGQGMPLNMTIRLDPFYIALGEGLSVYQGHLFFDGSGHIVGTEFALADFASPRGTTYQNGIRSPFQARVVISSEGALLGVLDRNGHPIDLDAASHVLPPGLNKAQVASIMALWKSPQHQADRNRVLENNPFIVGMVSYKGTGQLIHELKSLLEAAPRRGNGPKKLQLALLQGEDGYKWVPAGGKPTQGLAVVTVEYKSPESVTDAGSFQYSVTQGTFPPEVSKALQFLAGKISRPYMKI